MRHHLQMRQWVPFALPAVFDFFANPENLPPLMPRWQAARIDSATIVAPPLPPTGRKVGLAAGTGSRLLISFRPIPFSPVRAHWEASIVSFAWDDHFCDRQLSGPFGYWLHCHRVTEETRGEVRGTVVIDELEYEMPFGALGEGANRLGGEAQVRAIFAYRQKQLLRLMELPG